MRDLGKMCLDALGRDVPLEHRRRRTDAAVRIACGLAELRQYVREHVPPFGNDAKEAMVSDVVTYLCMALRAALPTEVIYQGSRKAVLVPHSLVEGEPTQPFVLLAG